MKNKVFGQISVIAFEQCPTLRSNLTKRRQPSRKVKKKTLKPGILLDFQLRCSVSYQRSSRQLFETKSVIFGKIGCIEKNLQNEFWKKVSGYAEHMKTLTHTINNALFLESCVIVLVDFKNAFGNGNHDHLIESLKLHHVHINSTMYIWRTLCRSQFLYHLCIPTTTFRFSRALYDFTD